MKNNNPHIGSSFYNFLNEENLLTQINEVAIKRVIAWQLQHKTRRLGRAIAKPNKHTD
jgi:antitoxin HicB